MHKIVYTLQYAVRWYFISNTAVGHLSSVLLFIWCKVEVSDRVLMWNSSIVERFAIYLTTVPLQKSRVCSMSVSDVSESKRKEKKEKALGCDWQAFCSLEPGHGFEKMQSKAFHDSAVSRIRRSAILRCTVLTKSVPHIAQNMKESAWYSSH